MTKKAFGNLLFNPIVTSCWASYLFNQKSSYDLLRGRVIYLLSIQVLVVIGVWLCGGVLSQFTDSQDIAFSCCLCSWNKAPRAATNLLTSNLNRDPLVKVRFPCWTRQAHHHDEITSAADAVVVDDVPVGECRRSPRRRRHWQQRCHDEGSADASASPFEPEQQLRWCHN